MTRIRDEQFEATGYDETWSEGENVGAGSTLDEDYATSSVSGAPSDWDSKCLRVVKASGEQAYVGHDLSPAETTLYFRCEIIIGSFPDALSQFQTMPFLIVADSGGTQVLVLRVQERGAANNGPYQFQFVESSSGSNSSHNSADIAADTRYRIEIEYDIAGNSWEWRIDDATQHSGTFSGGPSEIQNDFRVGVIGANTSALEWFLDNIALDDADWIGAEMNNIAAVLAAMDSAGPA